MESNIIETSFVINLKLLRAIGLYPFEAYKLWYKIYGWVLYLSFMYLVPILGIVRLFKSDQIDIISAGDNAFLLFDWTFFIFKIFIFVSKGDDIRKCILYLQSSVFTKHIHNKKHKILLDNCKRICQRNTKIFTYSAFVTSVLCAFRPIFENEPNFPVNIWTPFDINSNRVIFWTIYIYILMGGYYGLACSCSINPLIPGLFCQAACQFQILKDNLQYLNEHFEEDQKISPQIENKQNEIIYQRIQNCIIHHNEILKCCNFYGKMFSLTIFAHVVSSTFILCFCCLELTVVEFFTVEFFSGIFYTFTAVCMLFIYSYYGNVLYDESNTVIDAIYMGQWYEFNEKCKKLLIILMERSKRPVLIKAGSILDLSLETFTLVCKKSYSMLAIMQNFKDK